MIEEAYVTFEVAKLLREKGFDEPCRSAYIWNTEKYELCALFSKPLHFNRESSLEDYEDDSVPRISAPTLQMAMKWLREVHRIEIHIVLSELHADNNRKYMVDIFSSDINKDFDSIQSDGFNSYEEACEAAIKYVLENLITCILEK